MVQKYIWRYFCITENKNIFEERAISLGPPTFCKNNPGDTIDVNSITLIEQDDYNYVKNNFSAVSAPGPTDDENSGYNVGSRWIYNNKEYVCVDATLNTATWYETTGIISGTNIGTGKGVFKQRVAQTLEFKTIYGSNLLDIVDEDEKIKLDIIESQIDINSLYGAPSSDVVGIDDNQIIKNKSFIDSSTFFINNNDNSKKFQFQLADITSGANRVITIPDQDTILVGIDTTQIISNKTLINPKIKTSILDENSNKLVGFIPDLSSENFITISNAQINSSPQIGVDGTDSDIDLIFTSKGAGRINLNSLKFPNSTGHPNQVLKTDGFGNIGFAYADIRQETTIMTINRTPTALLFIPTIMDTGYYVNVIITAKRKDGPLEILSAELNGLFKNTGGTLVQISSDKLITSENSDWDVNWSLMGTTILVRATGENYKTIEWHSSFSLVKI